ncbi:MAG: hypothetical protein Q8P81_01915 [Nanoarchaeota archaeon]|nr:hypothetical protein [Nanoarchaeota archaeon]
MYFWKINRLKSDLLKKPLSESESFKYLFATLILLSLVTIPFLENNIWDVYSAIIATIITAMGVYYIYKCNKGAKGKNFLQRYISIGWVMGIRWSVLIALPIIAIYLIVMALSGGIPDYTTLAEVIFFNLLHISYFWFFGKHIKEVSR